MLSLYGVSKGFREMAFDESEARWRANRCLDFAPVSNAALVTLAPALELGQY